MTINPAIHHVPLTTPKDKLALKLDLIAATHGINPQRLFGDGVSGRTPPIIYAARHEAILAVIDDRPWWSYAQVASYLNLTDDTIYKHARRAGHTRNGHRAPRSPRARAAE